MKRPSFFLAIAAVSLVGLAASAGSASAAAQLQLAVNSNTHPLPADSGPGSEETAELTYYGVMTNSGTSPTSGDSRLEVRLPEGITAVDAEFWSCNGANSGDPLLGATKVECVFPDVVYPYTEISESSRSVFNLSVSVDPTVAEGTVLTSFFDVYDANAETVGGSFCAAMPPGVPCASTVDPTTISSAVPQFDIDGFDLQAQDDMGQAESEAATHPAAITNWIGYETATSPNPAFGPGYPVEQAKDIFVDLPPGMLGNPTAIPECLPVELAFGGVPRCPPASQIGLISLTVAGGPQGPSPLYTLPVFNMVPPHGAPARFAFNVFGSLVNLDAELRSSSDYGISIKVRNIPEAVGLASQAITFWGVPGDASHDSQRSCPGESPVGAGGPTCVSAVRAAFLSMPTSCTAPGHGWHSTLSTDSWANPGVFREETIESHEAPGFPADSSEWGAPVGTTDCNGVPFNPSIGVQPTSQDVETPAGLNVEVEIPDTGILNPDGISQSHVRKAVVSLPEGVTINPSQGEGLGVCTPGQYASEDVGSTPGTGCPGPSKIGTVTVHTPLLEEALEGSVFVAKPYDNPLGSLVALYVVIKNAERGVMIKLAGKVVPDEKTGQLVTTFDEIPQLPFSRFELHFREGVRSPLSTPRTCGGYTTKAVFFPWVDPARPVTTTSTFQVVRGVGGTACPSGGAPFNPRLRAGMLNNNALSFSPFTLRMTREDGEQEITNFSADLPAGLAAKLAGIPKCSEADLKATADDSGVHAIEDPICPDASQVGRVTAGYGVGSVQTHATGRVYLSGPYRGTPLSIATVVPAVVGPFDLGTVVVRSAFRVDPETAEVHIDSRASDPIPHILKGIELHLRDLRVYMDRPEFTLNPTNCDPLRIGAFLSGSGADFVSRADDLTVDVSNPFQAANCSRLGFKPKLSFKLKGGTKRGDFPALQATLKARPGDANIGGAVVTLPRTEFIEQGHIRTVCTRVEFNADNCPAGSIYGKARAITPLLDSPLEGPVYLRSNGGERLLPDLVATLRGEISVNAVGYIDSVKGRVRTSFATVPDTPVTKFVLQMQGGKKGLLVNHLNLCKAQGRADVRFTGQNGKVARLRPKMGNSCKRGSARRPGKR